MRRTLSLIGICLLLTACSRTFEPNPDPNHTHADFAVWLDGERVDFSAPEYMSGTSYDDHSHDEEHEYLHEHLHLHDSIDYVLHRHKPGLTLREFFTSLSFTFDERAWRMFVRNYKADQQWTELPFDLDYVFVDMDQILITDSTDPVQVTEQQESMTFEACMFSRTCPWMGDPPAEDCVADPSVPCVVPEEDL